MPQFVEYDIGGRAALQLDDIAEVAPTACCACTVGRPPGRGPKANTPNRHLWITDTYTPDAADSELSVT